MQTILLVDDHVLFREGLVSLFKTQPDFRVVGEAGNVQDAIAMAARLQPDMILMDFSLPDGTGLDATEVILRDHPQAKIIFLTMHEEDDRLFAAIRHGAIGYLLKNLPVSKLLIALRRIEEGEAPISRAMTSRILEEFQRLEQPGQNHPSALDLLTTREIEILQELTSGSTNREIADRLYISENTVKNHIHSILEKLKLSNRREAINFAQRNGIKGRARA
jgi:two-component system NarL family response regulator